MANFQADRLGGYVEVKDRIRMFYERHPDGRLVTTDVRATAEPDGVPRVWVEAAAYRTPDDPHPGRGWSWMVLPGGSSFTKGSELENTETSAWGRAIGSLGIGIDKSVATGDEIHAKGGTIPAPERSDDGGLVGTVELAKNETSLDVRQGPDGPVLSFRLRSGRGGIKVIAKGALATAIAGLGDDLVGQRVTAWGQITDETFTPKGKTQPVTYQVLTLERMTGPDFALPAPVDLRKPFTPDELDVDEAAAIGAGLFDPEAVSA